MGEIFGNFGSTGNMYIDVYYDDELNPPSWMARRVEKTFDGSLIVHDTVLTKNKSEAKKYAKKLARKYNLPLEEL